MDPIKQSLIDVAGNVEASERNVQAKVRANLTKKRMRMPIWIPALVVACFIAFIGVQFLMPDTTPVQTTSANLTPEDYEYLYELMQSAYSTHTEEFQLSFVADIAYQHYAKLKGITLDEKELARRLEVEKIALLEESESFRLVAESDPIAAEKLERIYFPHYVKARYYEELLLEQLKNKYPTFRSSLKHMLQFEAVKYFASLEESAQFLPYNDLMSIAIMNYSDYHRIEGAVMSVHEDHYIVVKNGNYFELNGLTTDQIASFNKGVYKIPIEYMDTLVVGDMVELYFPDYYMTSDNVQEMVPYQVTQAVISLTLEGEAATSLLQLIEPLERTHWKLISGTTIDYELMALNDYFTFTYEHETGIFTLYDMNNEEKIVVPKRLSDSIYELLKLAKYIRPVYSYDELVSLSSDELLGIFVRHGLVIGDDLSHLKQEQIGNLLKDQFDLMIQGTTSLSSEGYLQMAKDVQRIYEEISTVE